MVFFATGRRPPSPRARDATLYFFLQIFNECRLAQRPAAQGGVGQPALVVGCHARLDQFAVSSLAGKRRIAQCPVQGVRCDDAVVALLIWRLPVISGLYGRIRGRVLESRQSEEIVSSSPGPSLLRNPAARAGSAAARDLFR